MDKFLKLALKSLGLEFGESHDIENESDLKSAISERKAIVCAAESNIIELKDAIKDCNDEIEQLELIQYQIKVERYKELNQQRDIDIF